MSDLIHDQAPSRFKPDAYAIHGRNLIERRLAREMPFPIARGSQPPPFSGLHLASGCSAQVGIIGGGVGGLYTALILDALGITYEILEASDRTGGRLFTYKFPSGGEYDYYDVGAMRFPQTNIMSRLFELFNYPPLNSGAKKLRDQLIPYYFRAKDDNGFLLYNKIRHRQNDVLPKDAFDAKSVGVSSAYIAVGYEAIVNDVILPFVLELEKDLQYPGRTAGWEYLMEYDSYSTRGYMAHCYRPNPSWGVTDAHLPTNVINWCETFDKGTGWYDRAFSETVLEAMAFGVTGDPCPEPVQWFCLDHGSRVLSDTMTAYINGTQNKIFTKTPVTAIAANPGHINVTVSNDPTPRTYSHVISTVPLTCLRTLDLSQCNLSPFQANALRQLQYGPATKIGIQFRTPWWTNDSSGKPLNIVGGQSYTDRPIRTVVYPSYNKGMSPVLIASYCWTNDAQRLGALIGTGQTDVDAQLKALVLSDLAAVHDIPVDFLNDQFIGVHPYDWARDPRTIGAFAFFGPGNFEDLYYSLTLPAAGGRLHFAGEAMSTRHAWVEGALDSACRAVEAMLHLNPGLGDIKTLHSLFGIKGEWVRSTSTLSPRDGSVDPRDNLLLRRLALSDPELLEA